VPEREDPGALLGALGGDAVDGRLAHGDAAHLAGPLVVPVAQPPHRLCCEAPRLAAVQQNHQDVAHVHISLEPLRDTNHGGHAFLLLGDITNKATMLLAEKLEKLEIIGETFSSPP